MINKETRMSRKFHKHYDNSCKITIEFDNGNKQIIDGLNVQASLNADVSLSGSSDNIEYEITDRYFVIHGWLKEKRSEGDTWKD